MDLERDEKIMWMTGSAYERVYKHPPADDNLEGEKRSLLGQERLWYRVSTGDPGIVHQKTTEQWLVSQATYLDKSQLSASSGQMASSVTTRTTKLLDDWNVNPKNIKKASEIVVGAVGAKGGGETQQEVNDDNKSLASKVEMAGMDDDDEGGVAMCTPAKRIKTGSASPQATSAAHLSHEDLISCSINKISNDNEGFFKILLQDNYRLTLTNAVFLAQDNKLNVQGNIAKSGGNTSATLLYRNAKATWLLCKTMITAFEEYSKAKRSSPTKLEALLTVYHNVKKNPQLMDKMPSAIEEAASKGLVMRFVAKRKIGDELFNLVSLKRLTACMGGDNDKGTILHEKLIGLLLSHHGDTGPDVKNPSDHQVAEHIHVLTNALLEHDTTNKILSPLGRTVANRINNFARAKPGASETLEMAAAFWSDEETGKLPIYDSFVRSDAFLSVRSFFDSQAKSQKISAYVTDKLTELETQLDAVLADADSSASARTLVRFEKDLSKMTETGIQLDAGRDESLAKRKATFIGKLSAFRDECQKLALRQWCAVVQGCVLALTTPTKDAHSTIVHIELLSSNTDDFVDGMRVLSQTGFSKAPSNTTPIINATDSAEWAKDWKNLLSSTVELNKLVVGAPNMSTDAKDYTAGVEKAFTTNRNELVKALVKFASASKKVDSWSELARFPFEKVVKATGKSVSTFLEQRNTITLALNTLCEQCLEAFSASLPDNSLDVARFKSTFLPVEADIIADKALYDEMADASLARDDTSAEKLAMAILIITKDTSRQRQVQLRWMIAQQRVKALNSLKTIGFQIRDINPDSEQDVLVSYAEALIANVLTPVAENMHDAYQQQRKFQASTDEDNKKLCTSMAKWIATYILNPVLAKIIQVLNITITRAQKLIPSQWEGWILGRNSKDILTSMVTQSYVVSIAPTADILLSILEKVTKQMKVLRELGDKTYSDELAGEYATTEVNGKKVMAYSSSVQACALILKKWPNASRNEKSGQSHAFRIEPLSIRSDPHIRIPS